MKNYFNGLDIESSNDTVIETLNQLRNCKKKLERKKQRYEETSDQTNREEIRKLKIAILEYESRNIIISKKKRSKKKKSLLNDDDYFMNEEIKKNKMLLIRNEIKQKRIQKLWRKYVNKPYEYPKWSIRTHSLFPDYMKKIILMLFCYNMNENTIFSILPKEVMEDIIKEFNWFDFIDKKCNNEITIEKKGENYTITPPS